MGRPKKVRQGDAVLTQEHIAAWRAAAQHIAESTLETMLRHPLAIPVWSTTWPGPNRFGPVEQLLDALADAELPPDTRRSDTRPAGGDARPA